MSDASGVNSKQVERFPVIIGATASGKSALAVEVARRLMDQTGRPGEVITADSIQIYRGLDIGSAKPTRDERADVAHHLIDIVEPTERFSVDAWLQRAEGAVADVRARGGVPIIAGGTHLYIMAFLEGLFDGPEPDPGLRAELTAMDPAQRRRELERVDPLAAGRIHANDVRRTVRALEVYRQTGTALSEHQRQWDRGRGRRDCAVFGVEWPVEALNRRINARVKQMIGRGLVTEARALYDAGRLGPQASEALGYKQLIDYFERRRTLGEVIEEIKIQTRRFAKNQRTWMRRLRASLDSSGAAESEWFDAEKIGVSEMADRVVSVCRGR
ncbi:MAG: tRNA (adenosine(37)-N6)-dimethylallyltransferase MiaA [Phycisphaerales bacterium]